MTDQDLRFDLTVPTAPFGLFDPYRALLGRSLEDILAPLRAAPAYVQRRASGTVQVFPLAIPDGHSLALPLGPLGEVALGNEAGHLAVSVPAHLRSAVEPHLRDVMVRGPEVRSAGQAWVATFTVRVIPGTRRVLPLGALGEVGFEAA